MALLFARPAGLEPVTPAVTGRCSNQIELRPQYLIPRYCTGKDEKSNAPNYAPIIFRNSPSERITTPNF